jgi:polyisoprenoid-binding protein YceI
MLNVQPENLLANLAPGDYRLDVERSSIDMKMKTNWGLQTVRATFRITDGRLRVDEHGKLWSVSATIDATSFYSKNGKRDRHVKSADFLEVERYPTISFVGGEARSAGEALVLSGTVTIHGVTELVDVEIETAVMEGDLARFEAGARLDRTTFGITHMPRRIKNEVSLAIHAVAVPS